MRAITKNPIVFGQDIRRYYILHFSRNFSVQPNLQPKNNNESTTNIKDELESALPYDQIPGPTKFQLIRSFLPGGYLYKQPIRKLFDAMKKDHGSIAKIPGLFGKPDIVVCFDPNNFEKIFRNEGIWPNRPSLESVEYHRMVVRRDFYKGVEGVTVLQGEDWSRFRSMANPVLMQPRTIKAYISRMDNIATDFIENIRLIRDPETLEAPDDFIQHITNWTLESVCLVALDTKLDLIRDSSSHSDAKRLKDGLQQFFELSYEIDFKPSVWKIYQTKKFKALMKSFDDVTDVAKKYTLEAVQRLKEKQDHDERNINERSVLERLSLVNEKFAVTMAMDLIFAGVDTTSSAFTGILHCLAKNPDKQEKLREEILKILPQKDSTVTNEALNNLPYLRACIKESLRMYPVTFGNVRALPVDICLNGYRIPANKQILMPSTMYYRDENYFSEPNKFIPERWIRKHGGSQDKDSCPFGEEQRQKINPFLYLPFGFGPRMCIGKRLVDLELEIGLAKIIRNFCVEFKYPDEDLFRMNIINVPNKPLKYKFSEVEESKA